MTFKDLCEARYSCRAYQSETIPTEKLTYVLECARLAPSACNRQPWKLRCVVSAEQRLALLQCYTRGWLATAPAILVVSALKDEAWTRPADNKCHSDVDAAIITEHICLAAAEQGLGTCWICNFDAARCHKLLGMLPNEEPVALVPIGFPANNASAKKRKPLSEIVVSI